MNPLCTICRENFVPADVLYSTYCGHIFHFSCLSEWLQRSKTCPQCCQEADDKKILRVWLDDGGSDSSLKKDAALQGKINESEQEKLSSIRKVNHYAVKIDLLEKQITELWGKIMELNREQDHKNTQFSSLIEQLESFLEENKNNPSKVNNLSLAKQLDDLNEVLLEL